MYAEEETCDQEVMDVLSLSHLFIDVIEINSCCA